MMENANNMLVVLLIATLAQTVTVETSAAYMYARTTGICAMPSCHIELDCHLRGAHDKNLPIEFFHRLRDGSVNGPLSSDTNKFDICPYKPKLCTTRNGSLPLWDLASRLTVNDASDSDAGNYTCEARIPRQDGPDDVVNVTVPVWVQRDTEFEISASHLTVNLGDNATVSLDLKCDRTAAIEVSQTTNRGSVRVLPYMYKHDRYMYPYVRKTDGGLFIPNFSCDDEGTYTIAIHATRGVQLVKTTKLVRVEACEGCCNDPGEKQTPNPKTDLGDHIPLATEHPHEIPGSNPLAQTQSTPTYVYAIIVLFVISVLLNLVCLVYFGLPWYRQNRRSNRQSPSPVETDENDEAQQPMQPQPTTLNVTAETIA